MITAGVEREELSNRESESDCSDPAPSMPSPTCGLARLNERIKVLFLSFWRIECLPQKSPTDTRLQWRGKHRCFSFSLFYGSTRQNPTSKTSSTCIAPMPAISDYLPIHFLLWLQIQHPLAVHCFQRIYNFPLEKHWCQMDISQSFLTQ